MTRLIVLLSIISLCLLAMLHPADNKPQGSFVLGGGGNLSPEIYDKFINLAGGEKSRIVVIPSASENPSKASKIWDNAIVLHAQSKFEANSSEFVMPITNATGVWISGGDQMRLAKIYKNTLVEKALRNLILRGGVIGGTSAGASIVSGVMVYKDREERGFGLMKTVVDQHFSNRHRLNRLTKILMQHPGLDGIGIDENTALVIIDCCGTVMGTGNVIVLDNGIAFTYKPGDRIRFRQ